MRSSGVGYLLLEIRRKIGCPSTGVSKRHPGTPYASEILEFGVARMIEIKLIGSITIPIDGSVTQVCFRWVGYAQQCEHVVWERRHCRSEKMRL